MFLIALGSTFVALGLFGLADQYRRGPVATLELVVCWALAAGIGMAVANAGFTG